ncbi:hypothetical protein AAG570_009684 [Ranatra chinensis]|uniref:Uncharacterized protein n=1 Tax=Ranatra chinensis TaxID=642074 RepID=A0ABD0YRX9_9HEMI
MKRQIVATGKRRRCRLYSKWRWRVGVDKPVVWVEGGGGISPLSLGEASLIFPGGSSSPFRRERSGARHAPEASVLIFRPDDSGENVVRVPRPELHDFPPTSGKPSAGIGTSSTPLPPSSPVTRPNQFRIPSGGLLQFMTRPYLFPFR